MPHTWALVDSSFPTFGADEKSAQKIEKLVNYMQILVEALQYQLENLDTENWNVAALESFQVDTTADVEEQVKQITGQLKNLAGELSRLAGRVDVLADLDSKVQKISGAVQVDDDGNAAIGGDGKEVHLTGKVYINGKLME